MQCHIIQNALLHIAFSAILLAGWGSQYREVTVESGKGKYTPCVHLLKGIVTTRQAKLQTKQHGGVHFGLYGIAY